MPLIRVESELIKIIESRAKVFVVLTTYLAFLKRLKKVSKRDLHIFSILSL